MLLFRPWRLIPENIGSFNIELIGMSIQDREIFGVGTGALSFREELTKYSLDQRRAGFPVASDSVNTGENVAADSDRCLFFRTTIILQSSYQSRIGSGQP